MCGSDTTKGLSRNRSSANASGTTNTSGCRIAVEQSATSREVSATEIPTRDLNHWRSPSISEINAIGVSQTYEASSVRSSNANSGSVSRMAYFSRAATRLSSFLGLVNSMASSNYRELIPGKMVALSLTVLLLRIRPQAFAHVEQGPGNTSLFPSTQ